MNAENVPVESKCQECGQRGDPARYHPYLFCELVKLGHKDPEAWLADFGFTRTHIVSEDGQ